MDHPLKISACHQVYSLRYSTVNVRSKCLHIHAESTSTQQKIRITYFNLQTKNIYWGNALFIIDNDFGIVIPSHKGLRTGSNGCVQKLQILFTKIVEKRRWKKTEVYFRSKKLFQSFPVVPQKIYYNRSQLSSNLFKGPSRKRQHQIWTQLL